MGTWRLQRVSDSAYFGVIELEQCKRTRNGLNFAKIGLPKGTNLADDIEVKLFDPSDVLVLHGYLKHAEMKTTDIDKYEIVELASILADYMVNDTSCSIDGFKASYDAALTVNYIMDKILATTNGWTRGTNDTSTGNTISFYYSNVLDAIYKLCRDVLEQNVWFDSATKKVYWDTHRTNFGAVTYINKDVTIHTRGRKINQVNVVGASADIIGSSDDGSAAPRKTVAFQLDEVTSNTEAAALAASIRAKLGTKYEKHKIHTIPRVDIWECDEVLVDSVAYIVDTVEISWEETIIGLVPYGSMDGEDTIGSMIDKRFTQSFIDAGTASSGGTVYLNPEHTIFITVNAGVLEFHVPGGKWRIVP